MLDVVFGDKNKAKLWLWYQISASVKSSSSSVRPSNQPRSPPQSISGKINTFLKDIFYSAIEHLSSVSFTFFHAFSFAQSEI